MVQPKSTYKSALFALLALLASPAFAERPALDPFALKGRYIIAWSGITLGRIYLTAREDNGSYRMVIDTKTRGVGALVSDEKRIIEAYGTKSDAGDYIPAHYESRPQKDPEEDVVTLQYDSHGNLEKRSRKFDDDPNWRAPVPVAEINTARDPITAAFMLRRALYAALDQDLPAITQRTYDGLRLAEMRLIRRANARVAVMDRYRDTIPVSVKRAPIAGYTPKELKKFNKGDPEIRIYLSNDALFIPVRASAKTPIGELSMTLSEIIPMQQ
jgi:hypothetical protein